VARYALTISAYSSAFIAYDVVYAIIISMTQTIVVDTNVLISALIGSQGASREILRKCLKGAYNPLISNALFIEYEDVSKRKQVLDLCPLAADEIRELLNAFYAVCHWVPIYYLWRPNTRDEGDNFLIELALAGNATCIITHNIRDLQRAELSFPNLRIVTPAQLLRDE
jgi:putative PIN family toxin of toxin-antitoxin system